MPNASKSDRRPQLPQILREILPLVKAGVAARDYPAIAQLRESKAGGHRFF